MQCPGISFPATFRPLTPRQAPQLIRPGALAPGPAIKLGLTHIMHLWLIPADTQAVEAAPEEAYTEDIADLHGEETHPHDFP